MELVVSTTIICATIAGLLHIHGLPQLIVRVEVPFLSKSDQESPNEPPTKAIIEYISRESEAFARDALWTEAHRLFHEHGDWAVVESHMSTDNGNGY